MSLQIRNLENELDIFKNKNTDLKIENQKLKN